jgi:hypothetical protein
MNEALQIWISIGLTALLVAITGWYAWQTHRLAKTAGTSAKEAATASEAAQRSARAAELGLRIASLPLVWAAFAGPKGLQRQMLRITNAGYGPALNIRALIQSKDGSPHWERDIAHALAPGEPTREVPLDSSDVPLAVGIQAVVAIEYEDVLQTRYRFETPYQGHPETRLLRWEGESWVPILSPQ